MMALKHLLWSVAVVAGVTCTQVSVNRHFRGDIFSLEGGCDEAACRGRGSPLSSSSSSPSLPSPASPSSSCSCQCDPSWPVYREDRQMCVDSVHECEMADFVTGSSSEKIPFVFLPLAGQLVYPSATISIPAVAGSGESAGSLSPICVLSTIEMMTSDGWVDISNITGQHGAPFQLYNDAGKTFLQWLGDSSLHSALAGRLLLVHLLCKHEARRIQEPCLAIRVAGAQGAPQPGHQGRADTGAHDEGSLTERDYLAIGICAGFLVMLYIFAMIVFIVIRRKQKKDRRLREQFLQIPAPEGIGFKSSRLLGLDEQYLTDLARYQAQCRAGPCHLGQAGDGTEDGGWVATKWRSGKRSIKQMLTTDSPCDVNTMMMVNRKMLDAHKKMVENKLQMEVAHSVTCMSHPVPAPPACHGATCGQHTCPAAAPHCLVRTPLKTQGSKRFFPHLEQIPEESRNNTARSVANKKAQENSDTSSDGSITTSDIEYKEECGNYGNSGQESSTNNSNKSNPRSMDSGIATRSTSPSHEHPSDNETTASSSQGMYSDNETVDVASSDETEESDNEKEDNTAAVNSEDKCEVEKPRLKSPSLSEILLLGHNNLDFLSEIYNTAFSKVPKVYASDAEESVYSGPSRAGDYSSLDLPQPGLDTGAVYRNPRFCRTQGHRTSVSTGPGVTAVYVTSEAADTTADFQYTAGERLRIAVPKCEEQQGSSRVYTDKLTIEISDGGGGGGGEEGDQQQGSSGSFDPDTLERNLDRDRRQQARPGGAAPEPGTRDAADGGNIGEVAGARYSFRLHDQTAGRDQAQVVRAAEAGPRSSRREAELRLLFPRPQDPAPSPQPRLPPKLSKFTTVHL